MGASHRPFARWFGWPGHETEWRRTSTSSTTERDGDRQLLELGRVLRAHGLTGEVVVDLVTNRAERLDPGSRLETERGPLVVERSRRFGDRWLVVFEHVHDREAAERLRGTRLLGEAIEDENALWVHELVGCEVRSPDGERLGSVVAVVANPASDLLELDDGRLVPVRFVTEHGRGAVVVEVPTGLLD